MDEPEGDAPMDRGDDGNEEYLVQILKDIEPLGDGETFFEVQDCEEASGPEEVTRGRLLEWIPDISLVDATRLDGKCLVVFMIVILMHVSIVCCHVCFCLVDCDFLVARSRIV